MSYWITIGAIITAMLIHSTYLRVTGQLDPEPWCEVGTSMQVDGKPICAVIEQVEYDWMYEMLPACDAAWREACS